MTLLNPRLARVLGWATLAALVVLAMPQCWAGGKLYEMQLRARSVV